MGSFSALWLHDSDNLPEPGAIAIAYKVTASLSIAACLTFAVVILWNKLLKTALMRQVFCLCVSDLLVYSWELAWCPSLLNMYPHCIGMEQDALTCNLFYPMLRTLQMASVLWTTHIAIGVALV